VGTDIGTIGKHGEGHTAFATGLEGDSFKEGWKEKKSRMRRTREKGENRDINISRGHTAEIGISAGVS